MMEEDSMSGSYWDVTTGSWQGGRAGQYWDVWTCSWQDSPQHDPPLLVEPRASEASVPAQSTAADAADAAQAEVLTSTS
jgi:hypothetical protein